MSSSSSNFTCIYYLFILSLWTPFPILFNGFNPLLSLFMFKFVLDVDSGTLFQLASVFCNISLSVFEHFHSFWNSKSSTLLLHFPFATTSQRNLAAFRRGWYLGARVCFLGVCSLLSSRPSQWAELRECTYTYVCIYVYHIYINIHFCIYILKTMVYTGTSNSNVNRIHSHFLLFYIYTSLCRHQASWGFHILIYLISHPVFNQSPVSVATPFPLWMSFSPHLGS